MNSEKVKEIKKALENCQKNNCVDCPYFIDEKRCRANDLLLDTITLINELESENKILRKHNIGYHVANNYEAQEQLKEFVERLKEKAKEIVTGESVDVLVELLRYSKELVKEYTNENGKV